MTKDKSKNYLHPYFITLTPCYIREDNISFLVVLMDHHFIFTQCLLAVRHEVSSVYFLGRKVDSLKLGIMPPKSDKDSPILLSPRNTIKFYKFKAIRM